MSKKDSLKGYPIYIRENAKGTIEVLDGVDIYKWQNEAKDDGRWQSVLLVKSTYPDWKDPSKMSESVSVRVFSWRFQEKREYRGRDEATGKSIYEGTGEYFWKELNNSFPINKQYIWAKLRDAIEKYAPELPE